MGNWMKQAGMNLMSNAKSLVEWLQLGYREPSNTQATKRSNGYDNIC